MNLAVNARDAMPTGGRLTHGDRQRDLDENYARTHMGVKPGEFVMIAVSDTGIGMDAETRRHIFEPFFTTKEKGKGTGLGLATVYGIVKQAGGDIWVYSEPEKGTTFKLYFPRVKEPFRNQPCRKRIAPRKEGGETILVVEDEKAVRELTVRMLRRLGYTVLMAASGAEAQEIVKLRARSDMGPVSAMMLGRVRQAHHGIEDVEIRDLDADLARSYQNFLEQMRGWRIVLMSLAGTVLLVGGVGVLSVMLISFSDRRYEIGLRKSMGASDAEVLVQFLLEAVVLASLGALAGTVGGAPSAARCRTSSRTGSS